MTNAHTPAQPDAPASASTTAVPPALALLSRSLGELVGPHYTPHFRATAQDTTHHRTKCPTCREWNRARQISQAARRIVNGEQAQAQTINAIVLLAAQIVAVLSQRAAVAHLGEVLAGHNGSRKKCRACVELLHARFALIAAHEYAIGAGLDGFAPGRSVAGVVPISDQELEDHAWDLNRTGERPAVIVFDDGARLYPSQDSEGNGFGTFFLGLADGEEVLVCFSNHGSSEAEG